MKRILACFSMAFSIGAVAYDDLGNLEGKTVIASGDVESLDCPINGKYNCATWPVGLLRFQYKNICFTSITASCPYFCKGLIAIGQDKTPYFYTLGSIGSDFKENRIDLFKCPDVL